MPIRFVGTLMWALGWVGLFTPAAWGDGGTVRLSRDVGGYRLTVFTEPALLRAGPVDVSILVQQCETRQFITDADVTLQVAPVGRPGTVNTYFATTASATNKLFQKALVELPEPGTWRIDIGVVGESGSAGGTFEVDVAETSPQWLDMSFWIGLPFVAIVLFALHESLVWRQRRRAAHRLSDHRPSRKFELNSFR